MRNFESKDSLLRFYFVGRGGLGSFRKFILGAPSLEAVVNMFHHGPPTQPDDKKPEEKFKNVVQMK